MPPSSLPILPLYLATIGKPRCHASQAYYANPILAAGDNRRRFWVCTPQVHRAVLQLCEGDKREKPQGGRDSLQLYQQVPGTEPTKVGGSSRDGLVIWRRGRFASAFMSQLWKILCATGTPLRRKAHLEGKRVYVHVLSCFSRVWLFAPLWTVARQAPLYRGFSGQEYWSGLPCPPPRDLLNPGIEPKSPEAPALQVDSLPLSHRGSPRESGE